MSEEATVAAVSDMPANPRDLSGPEQILLGATRLWVSHASDAGKALASTERYFTLFGVAGAARSHATLLYNSATTARRPIRIDCLCSPCLTPDEARIVHAVGHAQAEDLDSAARQLASWMPRSAIRLTLPSVEALGAALARRNLAVPIRRWRTAPATPSPVTVEASRMVH